MGRPQTVYWQLEKALYYLTQKVQLPFFFLYTANLSIICENTKQYNNLLYEPHKKSNLDTKDCMPATVQT